GSGLARLLLQHLAHVADALLLVRVRLAQAADLRRHLAHLLPVDAGDGDPVGLGVHRDLDAGRDRVHDGMRVPEREHDLLPLDVGAVADAHDVELLGEALGDAADRVVGQGAGQAVQGALTLLVVLARGLQLAVLQLERDARRHRRRQLALGSLDLQAVRLDLDLDTLGDRDDLTSDPRHGSRSLPDVAEDLAAHALAGRAAPRHEAARGGQDVDAQAAVHAGDLVLAAVDPAARTAHALHVGDDALHAGAVLQEDAQHVLLVVLVDLEVRDVALVLEDAGDLHLELRGGDVDLGQLRAHPVADARDHVGDGIGHVHVDLPPAYQLALITPGTSPAR